MQRPRARYTLADLGPLCTLVPPAAEPGVPEGGRCWPRVSWALSVASAVPRGRRCSIWALELWPSCPFEAGGPPTDGRRCSAPRRDGNYPRGRVHRGRSQDPSDRHPLQVATPWRSGVGPAGARSPLWGVPGEMALAELAWNGSPFRRAQGSPGPGGPDAPTT